MNHMVLIWIWYEFVWQECGPKNKDVSISIFVMKMIVWGHVRFSNTPISHKFPNDGIERCYSNTSALSSHAGKKSLNQVGSLCTMTVFFSTNVLEIQR
jgi:hypothetical protein